MLESIRGHAGHIDGRRMMSRCGQPVGIDEVGMGRPHLDGFGVHHVGKSGDRAADRFRYGYGRIIAGNDHHPPHRFFQGNLVSRGNAQAGWFRIGCSPGYVQWLVELVFPLIEGSDHGHDFRRTGRMDPFIGIDPVQDASRIGVDQTGRFGRRRRYISLNGSGRAADGNKQNDKQRA